MPYKICNDCEQGIQVDEEDEQYFNYCTTCGKPLELVPDEEVDETFDLYEEEK